ncbi:MAG: hypothetical protein IJB48_03425 [Clostridia bacterium]|nr:hypothetical protein [Clostridia bacterium]
MITSIIPPDGENINNKIYRFYAIYDRDDAENQAFCVVFWVYNHPPDTNRAERTSYFGDAPIADKALVPFVPDFL